MVVGIGKIRSQFQGPVEGFERLIVAVTARIQKSQIVVGAGMPRLERDCGTVRLLRFFEVACQGEGTTKGELGIRIARAIRYGRAAVVKRPRHVL